MSDGPEHYRHYKKGGKRIIFIWFILWIATMLNDNFYLYMMQDCFFYAIWQYYVICRYIDPDLDQISLTSGDGRMLKEIPVLGYVFAAYWTLYSAFMNIVAIVTRTGKGHLGAHQTFWTHSRFGTLIRIIWFNIPVSEIYVYWNMYFAGTTYAVNSYMVVVYLLSQLIAFSRADGIHYKLDKIRNYRSI